MQPAQAYPIISSSPVYRFFPRFLKQYVERGEKALCTVMQELYKDNFDWQFHSIELEDEKKRIRHSLQMQIERQLAKIAK